MPAPMFLDRYLEQKEKKCSFAFILYLKSILDASEQQTFSGFIHLIFVNTHVDFRLFVKVMVTAHGLKGSKI